VPLKRSPEYHVVRRRVAQPLPTDSWQEDGLHFFVFELQRRDDLKTAPAEPPLAVFAMHPEATRPISAVVVTPDDDRADVSDLRDPERTYSAPMWWPG